MMRWLRLVLALLSVVAIAAVGVSFGLIAVANNQYVVITSHPWLQPVADRMLGPNDVEILLPVLLGGWLLAALALLGLLAWALYYTWRRRQYERLVSRLERELVKLRNLPFTEPAPLEEAISAPADKAHRRREQATARGDETMQVKPRRRGKGRQKQAGGDRRRRSWRDALRFRRR